MRVLVSWVRDFVDVAAPPDEIAEKLALRGFEVASIEPLGGNDAVIDFEVTANRPDCLSVLGFAREIAAVYDLPLRLPAADPEAAVSLAPVSFGELQGLNVVVEDADLCPRYAAAIAEVVPAVSPEWMTSRLLHAGVRPISPLVDVTNYVLIEMGHPMHAFDRARLAGDELRIRRARSGETIETIDGVKRPLEPEMLVIADGARPQAIAGVMGGAGSEVSEATRTIVFESAYFNPASVRRTSKRVGLKTEASSRFERGADIGAAVAAIQRAIALTERIGAGRPIGPVVDRYPNPRGARILHLRRQRLALLLGLQVPDNEVERILTALGLAVTPAPGGWDVAVPTFRVDLLREVDLIEEVGRHYGFERVDAAFPPISAVAPAPDARISRDGMVRRVLTASGLSEAVTFGFIEARAAQPFAFDAGALIAVANPLSAKFDTLRPSLLPGLVDAVAHNRRHGRRDVGLFEIGNRFTSAEGETRGAAIAWTGAPEEHWSGAVRSVDFFDIKGVVERLSSVWGLDVSFEPATAPFLTEGQSATVFAAREPVGMVGLLRGAIAESRGAPRQDKIFVAELNLDRISVLADEARQRLGEAAEHVRPLPRYPQVVRDLSIVVDDTLPAEIIRGTIHRAAESAAVPLVASTYFDRYKGKGLADGKISLSVRLVFQSPDRTLTDTEVQAGFESILSALIKNCQAVQR